jgi:hypothetical protein
MLNQNAPSLTATPKDRILSTEDDPDTRDLVHLLIRTGRLRCHLRRQRKLSLAPMPETAGV